MDEIDHVRRGSFDRNAEQYDQVRPAYPEALIDDLFALSGIPADGRVLEVGAGTGKATVALARRGHPVIALEPGAAMAAVLRRNVGPTVEIVETTFEDWPASPVALVVAAQSFHWVTPSVRYAKAAAVLAPGGALALLRTDKGALEPGLRAELDDAYAAHFPAARARTVDESIGRITAEIDDSGAFGPVTVRTHPWATTLSTVTYLRLLDTYSDHAVLDGAAKAALYAAIAAAIDRRGGAIAIPYVAVLHLARVRV